MERILAITDFSSNSKTGIRYALNLVMTMRTELVILYVFYVLRASSWSGRTYNNDIQRNNDNYHAC